MSKFYFTISAGRTGTAWLTDFLKTNLGITSIHEPLEIDDFGINMPDIRVMRSFNDRGLDDHCNQFWQRKFENLCSYDDYVETNHTLAKCGLVEWVAKNKDSDNFKFIILRRNKISQCISYLTRGDFINVTIEWQWYLSPAYRNIILSPEPFLKMGQIGRALWYTLEMECRQEYYKYQFGNDLDMFDITLEDVTKKAGASRLLKWIGIDKEPVIPPPKNQAHVKADEELRKNIERIVSAINFDAQAITLDYINSGRRLCDTLPES